MRFHSTPESVEAGEVTILAVLETVLAVSVALYVAFRFNFTTHIAFGAIVAPFLMLRTDRSTDRAVRIFSTIVDAFLTRLKRPRDLTDPRLESWSNLLRSALEGLVFLLAVPSMMITFGLGALIARVGATVAATVRWPIESLRAMPTNWRMIVLAVDATHLPELVPGIEFHKDATREGQLYGSFRRYWQYLFAEPADWVGLALALITLGPLLIVGYLPALAYRWSFKATSIVYLPLIWVARTTLQKSLDLNTWLKQIKKEDADGEGQACPVRLRVGGSGCQGVVRVRLG